MDFFLYLFRYVRNEATTLDTLGLVGPQRTLLGVAELLWPAPNAR
jgi:hypothetical protein